MENTLKIVALLLPLLLLLLFVQMLTQQIGLKVTPEITASNSLLTGDAS